MFTQLTGACARAFLVVILIASPALLLSDVSAEATQILALIAIFAAIFTFSEYASSYPSIIEFRDAPPFNRIRFIMLFSMITLVAILCVGQENPTTLTRFVEALGRLLGLTIDFPFSPVGIVMDMLPRGTTLEEASLVRSATGLVYLISLISITIFAICIRLRSWPTKSGVFNVWVNMPTFDPTAGSDVVHRLNRDARINFFLGLLLPYITPPLAWLIGGHYNLALLDNPLVFVWVISMWAFLPASLFMRGIALRKLSTMILAKRRRLVASMEPGDYVQPALEPNGRPAIS